MVGLRDFGRLDWYVFPKRRYRSTNIFRLRSRNIEDKTYVYLSTTTWINNWEMEVQRLLFLTLVLSEGKRPASRLGCFYPSIKRSVSFEQEDVWAVEPLWTFRRRQKILPIPGIELSFVGRSTRTLCHYMSLYVTICYFMSLSLYCTSFLALQVASVQAVSPNKILVFSSTASTGWSL